jgi:hypothetical protein
MSPIALRVASVLLWISALGLGLSGLAAVRSLLTTGGIAYVLGFPTFGGGAFERHGLHTTVPLVAIFLVVCVLEALAGWLVWNGRLSGGVLALALLPAGAVFWWGFDLPTRRWSHWRAPLSSSLAGASSAKAPIALA